MNPGYAHLALPLRVKIISAVFIIFGALAGLEMIAALLNDTLSLNLAVLLLPAGISILRNRSNGWRRFGLFVAWIIVVGVGLFLLLSVVARMSNMRGWTISTPWSEKPLHEATTGEFALVSTVVLAMWAFWVWVIRVFRDPHVRRFFTEPTNGEYPID